ncbi:hypothetical protein MJO28_000767 [Puccinia striiformis f. sp. tritici]|uniref:Uncharacterized protein n=1 Tax=Puccinia striiformis f. sp. tritici TaxID=168172 RepID=A0ACC0F0L8_9BASI|nr:hypothetical protein MJO28_000767 [Puccinia striiformis f. sp. tritici]
MDKNWIPLADCFVKYLISDVLHFKNVNTSRVKSLHAAIERFLKGANSSMPTTISDMHDALRHQLRELLIDCATQKQTKRNRPTALNIASTSLTWVCHAHTECDALKWRESPWKPRIFIPSGTYLTYRQIHCSLPYLKPNPLDQKHKGRPSGVKNKPKEASQRSTKREKSAWEHQIPKKKVGRPLKKVAHSEPDDVNVKETPEDPVPAALAPKGRGRPRKDDAAKIEPTNTVGAKRKQGPGAPKGKKKAKPPLSETESESSIDLDSLVLPEIPLGIVTRSGRVPPQIKAMKGNMKNDPKKLDFKTKDDTLKNDPTKVNATAK